MRVCIYTHTYMENLPLVAMWGHLEGVMLAEISRRPKDRYRVTALTCRIKNNQTHTNGVEWWLPGAGGGRGSRGDLGQAMGIFGYGR